MRKKIFHEKIKIIFNERINKNYFKIRLSSSKISSLAQPGQFIGMKVSDTYDPLLRRPFSIHRVRGAHIEILYEVVGKGTEILPQKKRGEVLDIIGPLGNGFNYELGVTSYELRILVAGGMGVAPLLFLADKLVHSPQTIDHRKISVLLGAKTKSRILCEKEFRNLGCDVKIATDDDSKGFQGKVTDLLKHLLYAKRYPLNAIYACGPKPMLKEISNISQKYNISAQLSLEEHMACGIGACLGCVVKTRDGYKRVCKEGPVFNTDEIVWA